MATGWPEPQRDPIAWEEYLALDTDVRREVEIVDGYLVPRERRTSQHQRVVTLLLGILGEAVASARFPGESFETNTGADVLLWRVPPTARKPDAVLHRALAVTQQLAAEHVVIAAEVLSPWSQRRDRAHKMADYADAGIPHYWLVHVDEAGALGVERYARDRSTGRYVLTAASSRGAGAAEG